MASELVTSASVRFSKGGVDQSINPSKTSNVTGTQSRKSTQSIGNGAKEVLDLGEITDPGMLVIVNRDATNFVNVFPDGTGIATTKIPAGEWIKLFMAAGAEAPQLQANTAPCLVEYMVVQI
jgi:hypothetical protein